MATMNLLTGTISGKLGALKGDLQKAKNFAVEVSNHGVLEYWQEAVEYIGDQAISRFDKLGWLNRAKQGLNQLDKYMFNKALGDIHRKNVEQWGDLASKGYKAEYKKPPLEAVEPKKNKGKKAKVVKATYNKKTKKVKAKISYNAPHAKHGNAAAVGDSGGHVFTGSVTTEDEIEFEWTVEEEIMGVLYLVTYQRHWVNGKSKIIAYSYVPIEIEEE